MQFVHRKKKNLKITSIKGRSKIRREKEENQEPLQYRSNKTTLHYVPASTDASSSNSLEMYTKNQARFIPCLGRHQKSWESCPHASGHVQQFAGFDNRRVGRHQLVQY